MRRFVIRLLFAALAVCALTSQRAPAAAPLRTPVRIEVPNIGNLQFLTLWVALGAGLFQNEGLEPRILAAGSPRTTGALLFKGEAEVALLPPPMFLGMMAEDKPVLLFASLLANEPINLIVRKEIAGARGIASAVSLRDRVQAIRGLRIGLAGEVAPRLRALFASVGMDADKDAQLVSIAGPEQLQAFRSGKVDALFAHTPYLETALVSYGAVLVADNSAGEVPALSDGQVHALATTRALARNSPEIIAGVTRAIAHALTLIHEDPKAAVDAIIASGMVKTERAQLDAIVAIYGPAVPRTPQIALSGIERDATLYPAHPRAPDFGHTKAADYVAADFAQATVSR